MENNLKVNVGDLSIVPTSMRHAIHYMKACQESKGYLEDFLDWGESVSKLPFKNHAEYIRSCIKKNKYFPSFSIFNGERFVGFFDFSPACDNYGVQICYWVTKPFAGYGIATEVTDILVERAFLGYRFNYVELHIDEQNTASKRIPEKLGFSVQDTYEQKMGKKGSGKMQLWVKENPYPVFRTQVFVEKKRVARFGWSQSSRLQHENSGSS
jgi:RimJ/RimL family protein N-acetyltransferase